MEKLCNQDRAIIDSLFNPLLPLGEGVPDYDNDVDHAVVDGDSGDTCCPEAKVHNVRGVRATEEGRTEEALQEFQSAITLDPDWAAPYNNRAQLYRILRKEDDAIADLTKALELCGGVGTVGAQALVQKGLLHRLRGEDDSARLCFKKAAAQGSSYAKTQLVSMNPMAALCNQMLVKMVTDVRNGVADA